jgi:plasmid stability protein
MAILNIRKLPDDVHARLRLRAAHNGRSMEAEAREILSQACAPDLGATEYQATNGSSLVRDANADGVTITLTEQQLTAARAYAARHQINLDQVVAHMLQQQVPEDDDWVERLFALMDEAGGDSGGVTWTREELYDR